jgi:hypothetical protein
LVVAVLVLLQIHLLLFLLMDLTIKLINHPSPLVLQHDPSLSLGGCSDVDGGRGNGQCLLEVSLNDAVEEMLVVLLHLLSLFDLLSPLSLCLHLGFPPALLQSHRNIALRF